MNAEALIVAHLNGLPDRPAEAFLDVPSARPSRLITIERTGGPDGDVTQVPVFAVQCWAESRWQASELARVTSENLKLLRQHPAIGRISVNGIYNFPSGSGDPRYQIVAEVVTV